MSFLKFPRDIGFARTWEGCAALPSPWLVSLWTDLTAMDLTGTTLPGGYKTVSEDQETMENDIGLVLFTQ